MTGKVTKAQSHLPDRFTSRALADFRQEFAGIYPDHVMQDTFCAVGPMETFLGWLVQTGRLAPTPQDK